MSVKEHGAAGLRGRARRTPVDCAAHTSLNVMASSAIAILAAVVVMMFTVVGCTGPQEQGRGEAAGGEDSAQPAREAKASRTDVRIPPVPADGDYNCADFVTRAQAKIVLDRDPSDPHYLDGDGDGVPCEDLPARTDGEIPPLPADGDYNCADFVTRAQAKAVLDRDPDDPHYLDGDGDGVPCEDLPAGSSASAVAGSSSSPANVSATAPSTAAGAPPPPSADDALSLLRSLTVAPPRSMAGYSREEFPHWASDAASYGWREPDGSCDVRDAALIRDGKGVRIDEDCSITSGTWLDPYTGQTLTDSSEIDIDHVVPLANAWRSGASSAAWSTADREAYANDPEVLLSADAGANRTKGDKGPEVWKPPNRHYWCEYARRWIWIKSDWHLSVNPAEKSSLRQMLRKCGAG
jgi:Excalibur calcium-binding domain